MDNLQSVPLSPQQHEQIFGLRSGLVRQLAASHDAILVGVESMFHPHIHRSSLPFSFGCLGPTSETRIAELRVGQLDRFFRVQPEEATCSRAHHCGHIAPSLAARSGGSLGGHTHKCLEHHFACQQVVRCSRCCLAPSSPSLPLSPRSCRCGP